MDMLNNHIVNTLTLALFFGRLLSLLSIVPHIQKKSGWHLQLRPCIWVFVWYCKRNRIMEEPHLLVALHIHSIYMFFFKNHSCIQIFAHTIVHVYIIKNHPEVERHK